MAGRALLAHQRAHGQNIGDDGVRRPWPSEEFGDCRFDLPAPCVIGQHDAGPAQRQTFPGPGIVAMVGKEAGERGGKRSRIARGAQAHIGLVEHAFRRRRAHRRDQPLRQPNEVLARGERLLAVRILAFAGIVKQDEIEIGGEGHLCARHLAKGQQGGARSADHAVALLEPIPHRPEQARQQGFGEGGELLSGLLWRQRSRQQRRTDHEALLLPDDAGAVDHVLEAAPLAKECVHPPDQRGASCEVGGKGGGRSARP